MPPSQTSPQQRSDLARKAAQARWSRSKTSPIVTDGGGLEGVTTSAPAACHCDDRREEAIPSPHTSSSPLPSGRAGVGKPKPRHSWIDERFCLQLYQTPAGEWRLRTPSGLDLPATNSEISLWLDLESLRFQLSNYESLISA